MTGWHRTPPPPPRREWCAWHAGWILKRDTIFVALTPSGIGADYGQYACNVCAEAHGILPDEDSGEIRYGQERSTR